MYKLLSYLIWTSLCISLATSFRVSSEKRDVETNEAEHMLAPVNNNSSFDLICPPAPVCPLQAVTCGPDECDCYTGYTCPWESCDSCCPTPEYPTCPPETTCPPCPTTTPIYCPTAEPPTCPPPVTCPSCPTTTTRPTTTLWTQPTPTLWTQSSSARPPTTTCPPSSSANPTFSKTIYQTSLASWPKVGTSIHLGLQATTPEMDQLLYEIIDPPSFLMLDMSNQDIRFTMDVSPGAFVGPNNVMLLEVAASVYFDSKRRSTATIALIFPNSNIQEDELDELNK